MEVWASLGFSPGPEYKVCPLSACHCRLPGGHGWHSTAEAPHRPFCQRRWCWQGPQRPARRLPLKRPLGTVLDNEKEGTVQSHVFAHDWSPLNPTIALRDYLGASLDTLFGDEQISYYRGNSAFCIGIRAETGNLVCDFCSPASILLSELYLGTWILGMVRWTKQVTPLPLWYVFSAFRQ